MTITDLEYAGMDTNIFVESAFAETSLVENFGVRMIEAIKCKYNLYDVDFTLTPNAYTVCPGDLSDVDFSQRIHDLCEFRFDMELAHEVLECTSREKNYVPGFPDQRISDDTKIEEVVLNQLRKSVKDYFENLFLNGNTYTGGLCDGLLTLWAADANVIDVTAVPGNITASAIIGELNKLYNAVDNDVLYSGKTLKFAVAPNVHRAYEQYLTQTQGFGFGVFNPTQKAPMFYQGLEIVPLRYLPTDNMFLTSSENIVLATDLYDDMAKIAMTDQWPISHCRKVLLTILFKAAVNYLRGQDIVWYH